MIVGIGLWPAMALGQTNTPTRPDSAAQRPAAAGMPGPAGIWKGPLSIPGGALPVQISVIQPAANKLIATLDLPAKRLNKVPASLTLRGDTLIFYAATVDCRFVCRQAGEAGQELRGMWTQPGLRVPLVLHRADLGSVSTASVEKTVAVKATTYHTEVVSLTSQPDNVALAGTLSIPDGAGPFPAAVLLSDMGSQDRDSRQGSYRFFADIAAALARQGIAVLRLDDRGVGQSGGNGTQATTANLVHDAEAGLSYLRVRPSIDPARTGLIGHGEGGNVALLAAAQPVPPGFVVALAASGLVGLDLLASQAEPLSAADTARIGEARRQAWAEVMAKAAKLRTSGSNSAQVETYVAQQRLKIKSEERKQAEATLKFRRTMLEIVRQTASNDQAQAIVVNMLRQRYPNQDPALARARATDLLTPWYRYYLKFDPQASLADVQCPVLLLNGTDDAEVNAATNLTALEKGLKGNKRVSVRRLPGLNHWFQMPAAELIPTDDGTVDPVIAPVLLTTVRDWVLQQGSK
ncbi:alpha/beta hydrolase [Hymenobacter negativus]|uniref:Alpha/beta fold hydrolase n=1 Tax=Hymenobacter negativus TaxID=2795026 RepID=A0ABS0Q5Q2_9BACT|nr:alpha/beta fold hydrolase [Hymenobacter negativus]MBH8557955.1 alpha/beta fold hydrolase [Hymenobacter negativus]